ncbi:basal-body rod modification protein FlgD [Geothrix rubra]|uniref:Basal-body rod modification protein FlgD n=1 Tax=Geothrix rubra TaxID=2927977 RepID=A0ABQ5Q7J3_9BACT|nr:FlgD immunoglobulin-like domain containing protein [Geothrix rubra]GLH70441.1 basal-body rod modification protein FlgD [Geothrix rubra]
METGMITAATTTASTTPSTSSTAKNTLNQDSFLQLLVAQLKNQDPTSSSAMDPNQMVQQLTSFSSLEQATQTNSLLQGLLEKNQALFQAQAVSMVGKTVKVDGSGFSLKGGQASMGLNLSAAADVTLTVTDANGNIVTTLPEGNLGKGDQTLTWNGTDASGNQLPDGDYKVTVTAKSLSGAAVPYTTSLIRKIDSMAFNTDGSISLYSNGQAFSLANVIQVLS